MATYLLISKSFYYLTAFVAIVFVFISKFNKDISDKFIRSVSFLLIFLFIIVLCLRPIYGDNSFPDTNMYADWFLYSKKNGFVKDFKDLGFDLLTATAAALGNLRFFFILITCIHFVLMFWIGKMLSVQYFYFFIILSIANIYGFMLLTSLLRQEIAVLLVVLSFFFKTKYIKYLILFLGVLFHKSVLLLLFSIVFFDFIKINTTYLIGFWLFSTIVSFLLKGNCLFVFDQLHFDERIHYITDTNSDSTFYTKKEFRWDYWLFSSSIIFMIYYFRNYKKLISGVFLKVSNVFILSNSFCIWLMFSNHSYRFFLLSWSLIPLLLSTCILNEKTKDKTTLFSQIFLVLSIFNLILFEY